MGREVCIEGGVCPPLVLTSSGGYCSGRYASNWNAFLYFELLALIGGEDLKTLLSHARAIQ